MFSSLVCWKCGTELQGVPQPFSRRAECPACHSELHVCRMCTYYNPRVSDKCDEPKAEHPRMPDRANFCDYFKPKANAYARPDTEKAGAARSRLDALFGGSDEKKDMEDGLARNKLKQLFEAKDNKDESSD